jgi:thioester reductase-like protein
MFKSENLVSEEKLEIPTVGEFLAGKNVFITGATGFLGTVLIERLLSATPKIGKIYILIRDKNGKTAQERVDRLMKKIVSKFKFQVKK